MTIIAERDRDTVRQLFQQELESDVQLLFFTRPRSRIFVPGRQDCLSCEETRELLDEVSGLSDRLHLNVFDVGADPAAATPYNVHAVPTVILRQQPVEQDVRAEEPLDGDAVRLGVRFVGLPAGYEFSTLVASIVDVSRGNSGLSEAARVAVRAIDKPVHIQVFVTPT